MAGTSAPVGSVSVEVIADLAQFDAGLARAEAQAKTSSTQIAGDLTKVEVAVKKVGASAPEIEKLGGAAGNAAGATERLAAQWAKLAVMGAQQQKLFQANEQVSAQWRAFQAQGAAQERALRGVETAQIAGTRAAALHGQAWANLGYQVNDVATSLASGASPLMVLAQQGGQVYQVLSGARGGVGAALSEIGDYLVRLATPARLLGGLLAGGFVAAIAAAISYNSAQRDVELSLLGVGQAAGVSADQFNRIAERSASAANISVSAAREIASAFVATGKIQGDVFEAGIVAVKNYSTASKQDLPQAAQQVASALARLGDGGYEELAKKAGNFDVKLGDTVRSLLEQDRAAEAQILVVDRLAQAFGRASDSLTVFDRWGAAVKRTFSEGWDALGRTVTRAPLDLTKQLENTDAAINTRRALGIDTSDLDQRKTALVSAIRETQQVVSQTAKETRQNLNALEKQAINTAVPQVAALDQIQKMRQQANKVLNARENAGDRTSPDYAAAKKSLEAYTRAEADYATAGGPANIERYKANEILKAGLQVMQAKTPADRAAAAAEQARAEAIGSVVSQSELDARKQDARTKVIREAQQASADQSKAMGEQTRTANELANATSKQGKSVEYLAAARKVDEQINAGTIDKAERETKIREQLQSQLGALNKQYAERTRTQADSAQVQQRLNDRVAAGTIAQGQAQRLQASEIELQRLGIERDAASGEAKAELAKRYDELRAATEAQMSAEDRSRVLGLTEDENRRIKVLERERELLGETVTVRSRELAILQAKQGLERQGISTSSPEAQTYLNRVALRSDMETAKAQYERLAQDISQVVSGIFDDMFKAGNKGMAGFFDSFSRGFARIGSRMIEQNIIAPLLGGQGGFAGGANGFDLKKLLDFSGIEKAVSSGSEKGILGSFEGLLKPRTGADGKAVGGFASSPLGGGLISAGAGAAIGYQSQSPMMGAFGGGLAGFAVGGPIGGIIGAGAGLLGGLFGQSEAKKAAKKQAAAELQAAKDAYAEAAPQIAAMRRTFTGEGNGSVMGQVDAAFTQMRQANVAASKAGDTATASRLVTEFEGYFQRLYVVFQRSFSGTLEEMQAGLGTNGPFAQAAAAVSELGESLKGFIVDTKAIAGADLLEPARRAAQESALASLEPTKALSATQTELGRIRGTAAGLTQVLIDLGMSADAAAVAIQERTAKAMDGLRATFSVDLATKTNDALGKSYLNEVASLVKERQGLLADAAAIGVDAAQVEAYFTAAAQKIVDGSELTGDAFEALVRQFPELTGQVHAFTEALDTAAAKAATASRALGFQDRLFAAQNDTSGLDGQLAVYDRQAQREREDEVKAGGQAMADLEAAQYAERLKIVKDYNAQATATTKQTLDQARTAFDTFARSIRDYLDGLNTGSQSTLSPADRLAAARQTYADRLTSAQGGDRDALDGITGNATNRLDAARAYYGSSQGYQDELAQVKASLALLPKQVSAEQFIVNAVEAAADETVAALEVMRETLRTATAANSPAALADALNDNFAALDTSLNGLLDYSELVAGLGPLATKDEQLRAKAIFDAIDANGDGQLDKLELVRARAAGTEAQASATKDAVGTGNDIANQQKAVLEAQQTLADQQVQVLAAIQIIQDVAKNTLGDSKILLAAISDLSGVQRDQLAALNRQFSMDSAVTINGYALDNNMVTALNKIVYNTAGTFSKAVDGKIPAAYASGGWVSGPGTGTSDSISAMLSNGEFVVQAAAARAYGPILEAMNDNRFSMPTMGLPMPVPASGGAGDFSAMVAELRSLRAEVAALRGDVREGTDVAEQGHMATAAEVRRNTSVVEDGNATASRQALKKAS